MYKEETRLYISMLALNSAIKTLGHLKLIFSFSSLEAEIFSKEGGNFIFDKFKFFLPREIKWLLFNIQSTVPVFIKKGEQGTA